MAYQCSVLRKRKSETIAQTARIKKFAMVNARTPPFCDGRELRTAASHGPSKIEMMIISMRLDVWF